MQHFLKALSSTYSEFQYLSFNNDAMLSPNFSNKINKKLLAVAIGNIMVRLEYFNLFSDSNNK
jgi:hypothetical protein